MVELMEMKAPNVIGVRISGKIEKADIEKIKKEIDARLAIFKKLRAYVEVKSFEGITLDALAEDLKLAFPLYGGFEKKAVVCDKGWIGKLVGFGDRLFPGVEVRHFSFDRKREALEWVES